MAFSQNLEPRHWFPLTPHLQYLWYVTVQNHSLSNHFTFITNNYVQMQVIGIYCTAYFFPFFFFCSAHIFKFQSVCYEVRMGWNLICLNLSMEYVCYLNDRTFYLLQQYALIKCMTCMLGNPMFKSYQSPLHLALSMVISAYFTAH